MVEKEPEPFNKPVITREELLEDCEHDPEGAEAFVALLHDLRRQRAAALRDQSD